jgi:cytoskeletal protein RodZ
MPNFKKRELSSDEPLGKQLRAVRRTAKLSLDQVATQTKISKKYIQALESGKYDELPAEVYAKGFLENYAEFLGFPADEVLTQYKRERGLTPKPKSSEQFVIPGQKVERPKVTITPRTLWVAGASLILLIVVGYLLTQVSVFAAPPELELNTPTAGQTVGEESVTVQGKTDPGAILSINGQPIPTDTDGSFKEEVRLLSGTNSLRVTARNKNGRERTVTRSVVVQVAGATPAPGASATPVPGFLFIVRIGPNSAYVTVNVDGKNAFQGLLTANTSQTFTANDRVLLTTSNAGSTQVFINGKDLGAVGSEGQTRRGKEYKVADYRPANPTPSPK